jgi:hypothetical protein
MDKASAELLNPVEIRPGVFKNAGTSRMTTERDIYASANVLITKHGVDALKVAQERLEEFEAQRDVAGADVWWRILNAIEVLRQPRPQGPLN